MISRGELLTRTYLVAGNTLECIDGKPRHSDLIDREISADHLKLKMTLAPLKGPFLPKTAKDALKQARLVYNGTLASFTANEDDLERRVKSIESIIENYPDTESSYSEVEKKLNEIRALGYGITTAIDVPSVLAANKTLRAEAASMAKSGVYAAQPVAEYIDDTVREASTFSVGGRLRLPTFLGTRKEINASVRLPTFGFGRKQETDVRDYFFIHNLLKGKGWSFMHKESGMLLMQGQAYGKALQELEKARSMGYDSLHVDLFIGIAHQQLGHNEQAFAELSKFNGKYHPGNRLATLALSKLGVQK
ncbi:MAG: hypothetical protein V1702_03995 [Candidatus Woesearchaeota archaeon]